MTAKDSLFGRSSCRIVALSAILAVAMFFTLPLAVAVGSDADYGTGEAGYTLEFSEKASEAELLKVDTSYVQIAEIVGLEIASSAGLDLRDLYATEQSMKTLKSEVSKGEKVESGKATSVTSQSYDITDFKVVLTSDVATVIIDDMGASPKMTEAINAIKTFFGTDTFSPGDMITITADSVKYVGATEQNAEYGEKNDTQCLQTSQKNVDNEKIVTKATIAYKPLAGESKSITVDVDAKSIDETTYNYVYGKDLKDVNNYDSIKVKMKMVPKSLSYNLKISVNDTDYKVDDILSETVEMESPSIAIVKDKTDIKVNTALKTFCDNLKDSENVTTQVGYDKAESMYDSAANEVSSSGGGVNIVLIVVIVIVVIAVIGAIAFFIIKKKKA